MPSRRHLLRLLLCLVTLAVALGLATRGPAIDHADYQPAEGDVLFQALGSGPVSELIAGSTESPYTHCGMVLRRAGQWLVIEAIGPVREIPLSQWLAHGRRSGFAAYRLRPEFQSSIPSFIAAARTFLGRPYDPRYRFDDECIYCSELVFKAWRLATNTDLGRLRKVRELKWEPYRKTIEQLEGGEVPLDRELITPRDLAEASQLVLVHRRGI
ncbi:MAG: hypothetical protein JSR82_21095 [Verrucomicrobia bacterium]|nr:hypothetical protein [Verrucomicrobiota bacterium]